jgi:large conductance mechanosensitive channel
VGGVDFSNLYINLGAGEFESLAAAEKAGAPLVKYGVFINTALDFLIVAFVIFMAIKAINKMKRNAPEPEPEAPKEDPEDIKLLREIRDALKQH